MSDLYRELYEARCKDLSDYAMSFGALSGSAGTVVSLLNGAADLLGHHPDMAKYVEERIRAYAAMLQDTVDKTDDVHAYAAGVRARRNTQKETVATVKEGAD